MTSLIHGNIKANSVGVESSRVVTRDQEGQRESGYQELKEEEVILGHSKVCMASNNVL